MPPPRLESLHLVPRPHGHRVALAGDRLPWVGLVVGTGAQPGEARQGIEAALGGGRGAVALAVLAAVRFVHGALG